MSNQVVATDELPPTIGVERAAKILGLGRNLAYQLARSGQLPGVAKLGSRYVVVSARLRRFLEGEEPA